MSKYLVLVKNSWSSAIQYRMNTFVMLFMLSIRLLSELFFWVVYYKASGKAVVFGYSFNSMVTYYLFMNVYANTIMESSIAPQVMTDIKDGGLSKCLIMPLNTIGYYFAGDAAKKTFNITVAFFALLPLAVIIQRYLSINFDAMKSLLFVVCTLLSVLLSFFMYISIGMLAFWLTEIRQLFMAIGIIIDFLSGSFFPLNILPERIFEAIKNLPFYYMVFFPVNAALSGINVQDILKGMIVQVFWVVLLGFASVILLKRGRKRYEGIGI